MMIPGGLDATPPYSMAVRAMRQVSCSASASFLEGIARLLRVVSFSSCSSGDYAPARAGRSFSALPLPPVQKTGRQDIH